MEKAKIADLRQEYSQRTLDPTKASADPIEQFEFWFSEALENSDIAEPNAMTLATATKSGYPSARTVLLKDFGSSGFTFFTNYDSRKGAELLENPLAAVVFWWPPLQRQVRIEGKIEKLPVTDSENYFQSRPRSSQIGAWASPQSRVVAEGFLEENVAKLETQFSGATKLPVPPQWGGYRLIPERMEFWQGRPSRLHDRVAYEHGINGWKKCRLAP